MLWSNSVYAAVLRQTLIALALAAAPLARSSAQIADAGSPQATDGDTPVAVRAASLTDQLVAALDRVFRGPHVGERAIHTKGIVLIGTFIANPDAMSLSS